MARFVRRLFFLAVCAILVAGAVNLVGVRSGDASASGGGFEISVKYDEVTRPGLATTIEVEIHRDGGFPGSISLAFTSDYLDILDVNGVDPEPLGGTATADDVIMYFEAPKSTDTMTIGFDARIQPDIQLKRVRATVSVVDGSNQPLASARISTFVMP